jgi:hypothetical protein
MPLNDESGKTWKEAAMEEQRKSTKPLPDSQLMVKFRISQN